jgi:hypothetical protein
MCVQEFAMAKSLEQMILDECFWEYTFGEEDIRAMAHSHDPREQTFLFGKILENATHLLRSMRIFDDADRVRLIEAYTVGTFNRDFLTRRIQMLRFYYLDQPLEINELKWAV